MKYRFAINVNGQLTKCTASEENVGRGRCNHIEHQRDGESLQDFMQRNAPVSVFNHIKPMQRKIVGSNLHPKAKFHDLIQLKNGTYLNLEIFTDLTKGYNNTFAFKKQSEDSFYTLKVNGKIIIRTNEKKRFLNLFFPEMQDSRMKPSTLKDFPNADSKQVMNYLLNQNLVDEFQVQENNYDYNYNQIVENNRNNF